MSPLSCFEHPTPSREDGFTLLEVLVAVSLLAIVLTAVYGIFGTVHATKQRLDSDSAEYHRARVTFDRLGRELQGAYLRSGQMDTLLRGGRNDQGEVFLELTTTATTPLSTVGTNIALVRYRLAEDRDTETGKRVLLRGESPLQENEALADRDMMRLAPGIGSMRLRFYRDGAWQEQWESQQDGIPELVEVSLLVGRAAGEDISFISAFELPELADR